MKIENLVVMISGLNWLLLNWTCGAWFGGFVEEPLMVPIAGWVRDFLSFCACSKRMPELYKVADITVTTLA